jgi:chemotaxis protein MotB
MCAIRPDEETGMSLAARRRQTRRLDYWPSFVDALSTLLLVIIFLLSVFMLAQFFLTQEISGRDSPAESAQQSDRRTDRVAGAGEGQQPVDSGSASELAGFAQQLGRRTLAPAGRAQRPEDADGEGESIQSQLESALEQERRVSQGALARVELLTQQISALRRQLAAIEAALEASESRDRDSQAQIADLGRRLNAALAQRVQELARYRSDFFGRLREILSQRSDIRVVGDRFVFQSEVLFSSGSADINAAGQQEMTKLADAILELAAKFPTRSHGFCAWTGTPTSAPSTHRIFSRTGTCQRPARSRWCSIWSSRGVPPNRLVAAGFGENQPLVAGSSDAALAQNRRIELKLTER